MFCSKRMREGRHTTISRMEARPVREAPWRSAASTTAKRALGDAAPTETVYGRNQERDGEDG